jgi:hypothetical protein
MDSRTKKSLNAREGQRRSADGEVRLPVKARGSRWGKGGPRERRQARAADRRQQQRTPGIGRFGLSAKRVCERARTQLLSVAN